MTLVVPKWPSFSLVDLHRFLMIIYSVLCRLLDVYNMIFHLCLLYCKWINIWAYTNQNDNRFGTSLSWQLCDRKSVGISDSTQVYPMTGCMFWRNYTLDNGSNPLSVFYTNEPISKTTVCCWLWSHAGFKRNQSQLLYQAIQNGLLEHLPFSLITF